MPHDGQRRQDVVLRPGWRLLQRRQELLRRQAVCASENRGVVESRQCAASTGQPRTATRMENWSRLLRWAVAEEKTSRPRPKQVSRRKTVAACGFPSDVRNSTFAPSLFFSISPSAGPSALLAW